MTGRDDFWYVRLPDGRMVRVRSTDTLRSYLRTGRVPWDSQARRSRADTWQPLRRVQAFADLPRDGPPSADEPARGARPVDVRPLGVRGLVEELFNAFDYSLSRAKLSRAVIPGLGLGAVLIVGEVGPMGMPERQYLGMRLCVLALAMLLFSLTATELTLRTFIELSRLRPARATEIRVVLARHTLKLFLTHAVLAGAIVGLVVLLRHLPDWIGPELAPLQRVVHVVRLVVEVVAWPILATGLLLTGPIQVIEEASPWQVVRQWAGMLRQHLGRIVLYEAIAFSLAAMVTLPLFVPLLLAVRDDGTMVEGAAARVLAGLALSPALAYLLVANVFIYLNLRYEFFHHARE